MYDAGLISLDYQPVTADWSQIFGGGEGPAFGGFEAPRASAPGFDWSEFPSSWTADDEMQQAYAPAQGGMGVGAPSVSLSDRLRDPGTLAYSTTPGMDTPGPTIGQPTGSSGGERGLMEDERFKRDLWKMGLGAAGSIGAAGLSAGIRALQGQPKAPRLIGLPSSPAAQPYQTAPLEPLPGTKASPLISGGPRSTTISQGVEDRMRRGGRTGGMALY